MKTIDYGSEILIGAVASLVLMLGMLIRFATQDDSPEKQRAKRLALFVGVGVALGVGLLEVGFFNYGNARYASYVVVPVLFAVMAILGLGVPYLYRVLRKGKELEVAVSSFSLPKSIDGDVRLRQQAVWQELREMSHMQETLEGELFSLVTGERIYWSSYRDEPCLAIEFSPQSAVSLVRFETLRKYAMVQSRIERLLAMAQAQRGGL